ncbi:MAG: cbb3-type cytochrome c oxidase subunit I [Rhodospirillales bacterium]|nr:MAG: cbb3-type cytochrome c oxidase subunit I [Rhodospirillales bacterium]
MPELRYGAATGLPGPLDLGAPLQRELRGWSALALAALAIAGVFALLLALSRVPGIEGVFPWPVGFFHKGLVIHVVFSFVVWFLAVFAAITVLATHAAAGPHPRLRWLGQAGITGLAVAMPLLFVPALLDRGEATLNNYVPTIIDPLYYAGLGVMGLAVALPVLRLFANLPGRRPGVLAPMAAGAGLSYLAALVAFGAALVLLRGETPSYAFNENLFWGGGHVLQFLNTQLLLIGWIVLAGLVLGRSVGDRTGLAAVGFLAAVALAAPALYLAFPPFSAAQTQAFTDLQYALGPAALAVALAVAAGWRARGQWREPAYLYLALSLPVFAVGGAFGLFVDGTDTRTPAHYHGVIAAVTLVFMGFVITVFLPALGRPVARSRALLWHVWLFAGGQLAACIGLFLAGTFGTPRKAAGAEQGLEHLGAVIGMALNGGGGLIAVIGGIIFVWIAARALLSTPERQHAPAVKAALP